MHFKTLLKINTVVIILLFLQLTFLPLSFAKHNQNNKDVAEFKAATIEQWAIDNQNQIAQLKEMVRTNKFFETNSKRPNAQSWDKIKKLQDDTLKVLQASHALADEIEKGNAFILAKEKNDAWQRCANKKHCSFQLAQKFFNKTTADQSIQAINNAKRIKQNIKVQINNLNSTSKEAFESKGFAASLDAMAKINAQTSNSLVDLNTQFASIIEMLSLQNYKKEHEDNMHKTLSNSLYNIQDEGSSYFSISLQDKVN